MAFLPFNYFRSRFNSENAAAQDREQGIVFVEAAIALVFLILFLFSTIPLGLAGFKALALQFALFTSARTSSLAPITLDEIRAEVMQTGQSFGLSLDSEDIIVCPIGEICTFATSKIGNAGQLVRITISDMVQGPIFLGDLRITRSIIVKNEPY